MIHLSQRDPRWGSITLGESRFTISKYGCTTVSLSMLSDYFQCYQPPDKIAKEWVKYTMDGYIIWNTLSLTHMAFELRLRNRDDKLIQASIKDPAKGVILNVSNGSHWVVAIRKALFTNDYWVCDPWTGQVCLAEKTYRNIVGSASFILK